MKIKNARATYSGGGIYVYTGQIETGEYFVFSDASMYLTLLDADYYENWDEAGEDCEWEEYHTTRELPALEAFEFMKQVICRDDVELFGYDDVKDRRLEKIDKLISKIKGLTCNEEVIQYDVYR